MKRIVQLCPWHEQAIAMPAIVFTFLFFFSSVVGHAQNVLINRTVSNTEHCNSSTQYGVWLDFADLSNYYSLENGSFIEYDNGTAQFSAQLSNHDNPNIKFDIAVDFSGRTFNAPNGSPKANNCYSAETGNWYYYTTTTGFLTGQGSASGALIELDRRGEAFQLGTGANVTDGEVFGGSGWMNLSIISQPIDDKVYFSGNRGDINIRLSGGSMLCDNITDPGTIEGEESKCGAYVASTLISATDPSGGSGAIEYQWLAFTDECPRFVEHQIPGATGPTYDPGLITETTYFVRCVRREGCTELADWKESNCIKKEVLTDCEPNCADVADQIGDYLFIGEYDNSKYYCSNGNSFTFAEAKAMAEAIGGHLVVINNAQENEYVRSVIQNDDVWIGLTDETTEGTFEWVNGDALTYTNWKSGEPNNYNNQDYARLLKSGGKWTDREASYVSEFVVEIPCIGYTPSTPVKSCTLANHGKADQDTEDRLLWLNFDDLGIKEYSVVGNSSTITEYEDGTALIEGIAERTDDDCYKWQYSVRLINKRNWTEWSALGRTYKPNGYVSGEDHTTWDYYELDEANSTFIGQGCHDGETLFLTHNPSDYSFGFQIGDGANAKNASFGLSGWYGFYGSRSGHGDFNGNLTDCIDLDPEKITIGDFVWEDLNTNGIQDTDEPGIPNVQVELFGNDFNGNEISVFTATDADGKYSFIDIMPGTYKLIFSNTPGGYFPTAQALGSDYTKDSNIDPLTGATSFKTYTESDEDLAIDAGYYRYAELGDFVWEDLNANGLRDPGEPGLKDVVITLTGTDGQGNNVVRTTTSGTNGIYFFNGIVPGIYKLTFNAPATYIPSPQNQGTDENADSDIDPSTEMTDNETLSSGENNDQIDAAYYRPVQLSGILWEDTNVDGLLNNGESGQGGISVMLLDQNGDMVAGYPTIQTETDGTYSFSNLKPGIYKVKFGPLDLSDFFTQPDANSNGNDDIDSDVNPTNGMTNLISLNSGQADNDLDAGIYTLASIGDKVWEDLNANGVQDIDEPGIQGVQIQLLGTDAFGNAANLIRNTDEFGMYSFDQLIPGSYKLIFSNQPAGFLPTAPEKGSDEAKDSDANQTTGMTAIEFLSSGEENEDYDAGYFRYATIGNFVWEDTNGNGIKDLTEQGIPSMTVQLQGVDGLGNFINQIKSTSANGTYFFDALVPGNYKVTFTPTGDFVATFKEQGTDDTIDSNVDPSTNMTDVETLISNENNDTYDAGFFKLSAISGVVFVDNNNDGLNNAGDDIQSGVKVNLLRKDTDTGLFELYEDDLTISNGTFSFINLPPSEYKVDIDETTLPAGFIFTPKQDVNGNSNDDIDSDVDAAGVVMGLSLTSGQAAIDDIGAGIIDEAILPVVLVSFTAEVINENEVKLRWATESEENNQFFIIERSTDGERFEAIGSVVGHGTTSHTNNYAYLDEAPFFGRNYYRLKQVDFNGRYDYSGIRSVVIEREDQAAAIVYPNPTKDFSIVRVVSPFETEASIEVVNSLGQVITKEVLPQGQNSQRIDMSDLKPGYYFIVIRYEEYKKIVHRVLKVQE